MTAEKLSLSARLDALAERFFARLPRLLIWVLAAEMILALVLLFAVRWQVKDYDSPNFKNLSGPLRAQ
jgi:hypothetical protein